jgi:hypothetical protein
MCIALGRIEEKIAHPSTRNVQMLWRNVGEYDAVGDFGGSPFARGLEQILLT